MSKELSIGQQYDYYGEYMDAQSGHYILRGVTSTVVYLEHPKRWDVVVVMLEDFNKYFKLKKRGGIYYGDEADD